jgi:hypothetical protein
MRHSNCVYAVYGPLAAVPWSLYLLFGGRAESEEISTDRPSAARLQISLNPTLIIERHDRRAWKGSLDLDKDLFKRLHERSRYVF